MPPVRGPPTATQSVPADRSYPTITANSWLRPILAIGLTETKILTLIYIINLIGTGRRLPSIGEKLDRSRGLGRGFDFLRVTLALGIVVWHSFAVAGDGFDLDQVPFFWMFG